MRQVGGVCFDIYVSLIAQILRLVGYTSTRYTYTVAARPVQTVDTFSFGPWVGPLATLVNSSVWNR